MISILDLKPNQVSLDIKEKTILLYGEPKVGKTTLLSQIPECLILDFENGTKYIPGVLTAKITEWEEAQAALRQLKLPKAKETYEVIAIDTLPAAWRMAEEYICRKNKVKNIGDIPYGGGYPALQTEFENFVLSIIRLGYGFIWTTHIVNTEMEIPDPNDSNKTIKFIRKDPDIPKRAKSLVNTITDLIGYSVKEFTAKGEERAIYTTSTLEYNAGNRIPMLQNRIQLNYDSLKEAITLAIKKNSEITGSSLISKEKIESFLPSRTYEEAMEEAKIVFLEKTNEGTDIETIRKIGDMVKNVIGEPKRISEITEENLKELEILILDMKTL